jgi:hypothetical protein
MAKLLVAWALLGLAVCAGQEAAAGAAPAAENANKVAFLHSASLTTSPAETAAPQSTFPPAVPKTGGTTLYMQLGQHACDNGWTICPFYKFRRSLFSDRAPALASCNPTQGAVLVRSAGLP